MDFQIGQKVLINTDNWFIAPNGRQYRAVFGTVHAILNDTDTLGIKTNARSTNWYVKIGNMLIAGCQIHYAVATDNVQLGTVEEFTIVDGKAKHYRQPSTIYDADQAFSADKVAFDSLGAYYAVIDALKDENSELSKTISKRYGLIPLIEDTAL